MSHKEWHRRLRNRGMWTLIGRWVKEGGEGCGGEAGGRAVLGLELPPSPPMPFAESKYARLVQCSGGTEVEADEAESETEDEKSSERNPARILVRFAGCEREEETEAKGGIAGMAGTKVAFACKTASSTWYDEDQSEIVL